jgi:hypothetical protein
MKKSLVTSFSTLALFFASSTLLAAPLLSVDLNDRQSTDNPDTPPGYTPFLLTNTTTISAAVTTASSQIIGPYTVTVTPFDDNQDENSVTAGIQNAVGAIDDRDRATPIASGTLTLSQIYDDFVFAGTSTGPTGGMNLSIAGLSPNTSYSITLYSFDQGSTGLRTANWLDANNASALVLTTSFNGSNLPVNDADDRFTGIAITDSTGTLTLLGRNTTPNIASGAVNPGVFLNGFELNPVPEPTSLFLLALTPLFRRRRL